MAVREILKQASQKQESKVDELAAKFRPAISKIREVEILRIKGSKAEDIGRGIECEPPREAEDKGNAARELAELALEYAVHDADGKRARYKFRALGEAIPNEKPPALVEHEIAIAAGDDDVGELSGRNESVLMLRETREFAKAISAEFVKVMGAASSAITTLGDVAKANVTAGGDAEGKKWDFLKYKVEMGYKADERGAELLVMQERNRQSNQTWRVAIEQLAPLVDTFISVFGGVVPEKARPTEAEVRIVFEGEESLLSLALELIKPENASRQEQISQTFQLRWAAATQEAKNACLMRAMAKIPKPRLVMLAAWIKAVTGVSVQGMAA